jgi:uncharacterized membrane protein (Fun14 family)
MVNWAWLFVPLVIGGILGFIAGYTVSVFTAVIHSKQGRSLVNGEWVDECKK